MPLCPASGLCWEGLHREWRGSCSCGRQCLGRTISLSSVCEPRDWQQLLLLLLLWPLTQACQRQHLARLLW